MKRNWVVASSPNMESLSKRTGVSQLLLRILYNRGIRSEEEITSFLSPLAMQSPDPFLMKDMDQAVQRIQQAIRDAEKIRIVGDYDQDGVCATTILLRGLQELGADVDFRIPDRLHEGYGLIPRHVEEALLDDRSLLITCDNGIQSFAAANRCLEVGIDLIVTDHHLVKRQEHRDLLPEAVAVVNPQRLDCPYPYKNLAGAGVALKLIEAVWSAEAKGPVPDLLTGYAAMGTVSDIVDLQGENRSIVVRGLQELNRELPVGLRKLKEACAIHGKLDAYALGYLIGPSINAAGRLSDASSAVDLMMTEDEIFAGSLSETFRALNRERQDLTETALEEAEALLPEKIPSLLFMVLPNAHESILGIVAGRLRDRLFRPVFLATKNEESGFLKGSSRSIPSYSMIDALQKSSAYLEKYGGHKMAAGFSLSEENAEAFHASLLQNWNPEPSDLIQNIHIDFPIELQYISSDLVHALSVLEPYGKGNPKPLFASRNVILGEIRVIGKNKNTLKYRFLYEGGEVTGIQFGNAEQTLYYLYKKYGILVEEAFQSMGNELRVDIVYTPQLNEYKGSSSLQLVVTDIR